MKNTVSDSYSVHLPLPSFSNGKKSTALSAFDKKNDDLYKYFRPYLILGRCIGLIPLKGLLQKDIKGVTFSKYNIASVCSGLIILWCVINICVSTVFMLKLGKNNASEIAWSASGAVFYFIGTIIFIHFLRHANSFISLFRDWNEVTYFFHQEDKRLPKDIGLVTMIMFTSGISENIILQLKLFPVFAQADIIVHKFNMSEDASPLETYYYRGYPSWASIEPYNPVLAISLFLINKFVLYAWNYFDVLMALFSRVLYFKFDSLVELSLKEISAGKKNDPVLWLKLVKDFNQLSDYVNTFANFFSPLYFLSYAVNTYYCCLQLHVWLTPAATNNSFASLLHAIWALIHIITKVLLVTLTAGKVHENALKILTVFYLCPEECYSNEIERTERNIQYGRLIAFHGMNCFHVTKPLILSFFSVVITFEIVLLQATATPPSS